MRTSLTILVCLLFAGMANAASIEQPLTDSTHEQTARAIFHELKCVVCEGQSLADSDTTLAKQMRDHVRRLVADGKSKQEVLNEFRASYGDAILLTPPMAASTALLWFAPLLLLISGALVVWRITRPKKEPNV